MKNIYTIAAIAAIVGMINGCSTTKIESPVNGDCIIDNMKAPKWVCGTMNHNEERFSDVGSSTISKAEFNLTRTAALANARAALGRQIDILIKSKVETFVRSTGISKEETVDKVITNVTKQVSKTTLNGSVQEATWKGKTELFVLVSIPKNSIMNSAKNSIASSFKNNNALWQQFKSKQSLENLEREFN